MASFDKIVKFKAILKDYDDSVGDENNRAILNKMLFIPIVIDHCNGVGPWSFSDATIDYRKFSGLPLYLWFSDSILKIITELREKSSLNVEQKKIFERLVDFCVLNAEQHLTCLKTLLTDTKTESEVQAILAVHYFQPLVSCRFYAIDKNKHPNLKCCPMCKEKIIFEDTSFGSRKVWHGNADIVLGKSIIKVDYTKIDDSSDLYDEEMDADNEDGEPTCKQRKMERITSEADSDAGSSTCSFDSIIDEKLKKEMKKKAKSQALAQTIVNSFCVSQDKSMAKQFIPSFLITKKEVRMMMYHCEYDMLLFSQKLQIWNTSNSLNISTLIYVWLHLNFDMFDNKVADGILDILPKSKFKEFVGDAIYKIYSQEVTRPLSKTTDEVHIRNEVCCSDKIMSSYGTVMQSLATAALDLYTGF